MKNHMNDKKDDDLTDGDKFAIDTAADVFWWWVSVLGCTYIIIRILI